MKEFSQSTIEQLEYYVYSLTDPRDNQVFYVGKGKGNRVYSHLDISTQNCDNLKASRILEIHKSGQEVIIEILRHGMTEDQAFEVESACIDLLGLSELTNIVSGKATEDRGRMTLDEIKFRYSSRPIIICEPSLLIIVNRLYRKNISQDDLYEITRGNWVLGKRRNQVEYAFSVYKGIVRQVYKVNNWFQVEARSESQKIRKRWRFDGEISDTHQHYIGGDVTSYLKKGDRSPTKYINC
jgi:hypothetical protein